MKTILDGLYIECKQNIPLSEYSSFRIGGVGEIGIFPKTREELAKCISVLKEKGKAYRIIGNGSNILFGDGNIEGAFIFTEKLKDISLNGNKIFAEAGASLSALASLAAENQLTGLEFAKGIPGSVGGGAYMNAGAYGGALSDIVEYSIALDVQNGSFLKIYDHGFGYRKSIYMENSDLVCVGVGFSLSEGDKTEINEKMKAFAISRREKQPLNLPSCGSYFKRPEGSFAGKLIEDAGLKGYRIGDAAVSEKHAGFIVNLGNATAEDVLRLEEYVKERVFSLFGVELEREVRVIK